LIGVRASTIFICYRRDDSARYANRLKSLLDSKLSRHGVFMDLEIQPGDRFVERVKGAISTCKVLLVLIGPRWLNATDEHGRRRLEDERDFVRLEIAMALERDVVVIPVLVGGGEIPKAHELPDELVPLIERTAIRIRDDR
jgi:sugar phosphate isomerase/epimerase